PTRSNSPNVHYLSDHMKVIFDKSAFLREDVSLLSPIVERLGASRRVYKRETPERQRMSPLCYLEQGLKFLDVMTHGFISFLNLQQAYSIRMLIGDI
ncbi:hypothetical protein L9F63_010242, partial [Diploptera punctata]